MKYTHYEDDALIEPHVLGAGTWRTYYAVRGAGWLPVPGSMKGGKKESLDFAKTIFPNESLITVYHSDGDERD